MLAEILITAVTGHPVLYDPTLFQFRDRNTKALAWPEVSRVVGWSVNECIKKWKGLRDTYRKNRRKEKERRRSGAGACGGKAWKYARIMAFIDPFMEDRHSQTNMAGPHHRPRSRQHHRPRSRQQERGERQDEAETRVVMPLMQRLITAIEAVSNRVVSQSPPEDSDSLFFRSLQEDFKKLSLRTREGLKFEMYRMVYEAKCGEVDMWDEGNGVQLTTL
ncbi:unnamed protein product [Boreogadus saida]